MPENTRGILVYELMCGIWACTVLVKWAPGLVQSIGWYIRCGVDPGQTQQTGTLAGYWSIRPRRPSLVKKKVSYIPPDLRFWGARSLSRANAPLNSLPEERKYTPLLAVSRAPWRPTCWTLMSINLSAVTIVTSKLSAAWHTLVAWAFQTIAENCNIVFTNNTTPRPLIHYIFSGRGSRWNCYSIAWGELLITLLYFSNPKVCSTHYGYV